MFDVCVCQVLVCEGVLPGVQSTSRVVMFDVCVCQVFRVPTRWSSL